MSAAADDGNRDCYRCKGSRMCSTLDARWPAPCQVCRGTGRLEPPEPPKPSAPRKRDPSDPHAWYPIPETTETAGVVETGGARAAQALSVVAL